MTTYHEHETVTLADGFSFEADTEIVETLTKLNNADCHTFNSCFHNTNDCLWIEFSLDSYAHFVQWVTDFSMDVEDFTWVEVLGDNAATITTDTDDDGLVMLFAELRINKDLKAAFVKMVDVAFA